MKKCLLALVAFAFVSIARATPPNQALLDGRPNEYDVGDLRGTFTGGGGAFGTGVGITNLYVTWDTNYLYIALQGFESDNKLVVMMDADPTNGVPTGATTTTNWIRTTNSPIVLPAYINFNDVGWKKSEAIGAVPFGLDYMFSTEGVYNNVLRITYDGLADPNTNNVRRLFDLNDNGNGAAPQGTPVDMVALTTPGTNDLTGFEVRIPWSVVYGANTGRFGVVQPGEIVPRGAMLRLFANIHNNNSNDAFSANDAIPRQVSGNASYGAGLLTTDDYTDVPVDGNDDGMPDLVGGGDVNAPFIRFLQGAFGIRTVYAQFNEALNAATATTPGNWSVGVNTPGSVTVLQTNGVLLQLTNDLPAAGSLVKVTANGVEDTNGNAKLTYNYLTVAAGGLTTSTTVRFFLETASGLGLNPGATTFFINGGALPLEFGFPPAMSSPLSQFTGSLYYRDVTFPPGTPLNVNYKYSGILTATGTNNYEAVRLKDFGNAPRTLSLNTNGITMVITDYLGAAAGPYRSTPGTNTGYNSLYVDLNRGDAGVRERTLVTFQLDLRSFNRSGINRVLIQGSDPLRGFNSNNENPPTSDFATAPLMDWNTAGLTLNDNGTGGDTNAGDGIYAVQWVFSTNGYDNVFVPTFPGSLVGNGEFDPPYYGDSFWESRRSPRSVAYKYYILRADNSTLESPNPFESDIEFYLQGAPTNVVLAPFVWNNTTLPPPPPSNSPTVIAVTPTGGNTRVTFVNLPAEVTHGVQVSTNLLQPWLDYGQRATGAGGNWTAIVQGVGLSHESFRSFSGVGNPARRFSFTPNPVPNTGAVVRFKYNQNYRVLAGVRNVEWGGKSPTSSFTFAAMTFSNQGIWYYDFVVPPHTNGQMEYLFRNAGGPTYDQPGAGQNYRGTVGGRATWFPDPVYPTNLFTVIYNPAGGPLATASMVNLYHGFDGFQGITEPLMTNIGVGSNLWTITIQIPSNRNSVVDLLFKGVNGTVSNVFDNNSTFDWHAFIELP